MQRPLTQPNPQHVTAGTTGQHDNPAIQRVARPWRVAGLLALAVILGLAFLGHLSPDMKLQWENLMALCGF
ncbi:MAG: hypothetical protein WCX93_12335 [Burkholderiaceae bacterium]